MKSMKFFTLFAILLFAVLSYRTYEQYQEISKTEKLIILHESRSLAEFISSFRQTYQDIFLREHIKITDTSLNLLPVKTISEISEHFSLKINGEIVVRTVSDRPRNLQNKVNSFEAQMISYFKSHPGETYMFIENRGTYSYIKPLYIEKSCLRCHGKRENAVLSIQKRYDKAYDYKLGEIRGVMHIKIKDRDIFAGLYGNFLSSMLAAIFIYVILLVIIYLLIKRIQHKEEEYLKKLEGDIEKKTYRINKQKDILHHQAHHDSLTGLPNRTLFSDRLEHGIELAKRQHGKLALFFIDLDNFKQINDSLGHHIGDKVLMVVSERLKAKTRKEDTLARLGGDEFTIIMENLKEIQQVSVLAQKIQKVLGKPMYIEGNTLYISCSIGISFYPQDAQNANDLVKYADAAMYKAKEEGRNNFQFYSEEMTALAYERVMMEADLRQAIKNEEFLLYYQPQVNGKTGKMTGMEALIRWEHPHLGMVSPDKFIPIAEESGLILEIDRWVMRTAMRQIRKWYDRGLDPGILSLNLSMRQLKDESFIAMIKECFTTMSFDPKWLELEVTEGQMMKKPDEAIAILEEIKEMGINIAIDDFGTGYSSLSYLKRLPVSKLKIDQSFIQGIPEDKENAAIVKATIALAKSLHLHIIAEGVEAEDQKEFLINNGCIIMQGYYFARPMTAELVEKKCFIVC